MHLADLRFLVVEDDELQREALLILLEDLEVRHLTSADDGRSGLKAFLSASPPIDIVISDLQMPGMDGVEFMRRLGETGKPVSVVLASAVDPSVLAAVENVATAYGITLLGTLQKPVRPEGLLKLLGHYKPHVPTLPADVAAGVSVSVDDIQQALAHDEFEPHFQPKVELATGRIRGFEALARWRRPGHGLMGPHNFIAVMEANGMIGELTMALLRKSATACRDWQAQGADFCVSVNISVKSLASLDFADRLAEVVTAQGVSPASVMFEVTESTAASSDLGAVLDNLSRLRLKGFGLSIDDYGTGYSSMQQLSRIAFTELKVDQTFVRNASRNESSLAILQSSLYTARLLKIVSVAEGLETMEDWVLLRSTGCDQAQGYFISRPMAGEDVMAWSGEWAERVGALVA